jgi:drug/metabolite transporter (DMT)-like permease
MWIWLAVLSGIFYTISGLVTRHILKGNKDAWAFSFYFSFIGAITSLPFMMVKPNYPSDLIPWLILIGVAVLIVIQNLLNFKSSNTLEASILGSVLKLRLVWVLLIGIFLLHESMTLTKIIGTIITFIAGLIIVAKFKSSSSFKGIGYAISSTIFYAIVIGLYKILFQSFNSQTLTFFIFLFPSIINLIIMPHSIARIIRIFHENGLYVIIACLFGGFANLAMNQALAIGEASRVLVIIESFLILTLVGENLVLKESHNLFIKIIAVVLATSGAVLIRMN